jgi:hypothetical protein
MWTSSALIWHGLGNAALQGPAHSSVEFGMPTADLLEDGDRADAGCSRKHRHDLAVPHSGERVGTAASTRRFLLRWQPWIGFDPIGSCGGKPGLRGGDGREML